MGTLVQNASVDGPCHTPTSRGLESNLKVDVDEGSSPEPPAKKAKPPAMLAARGPGWCRCHGGRWGARIAGRPPGRRSRCLHREQQADRRGGPSQNLM
eukprot:jgi/Tetstr1/459173/TSEL_004619.t1